jgi:hypothetical protein
MQSLDHQALRRGASVYISHVNTDSSELERASGHDPVLAIFNL